MLTFDEGAIEQRIASHEAAIDNIPVPDGWGCGRIHDNFSFPDGTFFRFLGKQVRTPGDYARDHIDHSMGATHEYFHPIVRIRSEKLHSWNPPSLKGFTWVNPCERRPMYTWRKDNIPQDIEEYVMSEEKTMRIARQTRNKSGTVKVEYATVESLSRRLCPKEILDELDAANRRHVRQNGH